MKSEYELDLSVNRCNWDLYFAGTKLTKSFGKSISWDDQENQELLDRIKMLLKEKQGYIEQLRILNADH